MTILELLATRDFLYSFYENPERETHPAIADCDDKFSKLKGKMQITNQTLCELLSEETGDKWHYQIQAINDFENDNLFHANSKSLVLTFSSNNDSFCALGLIKNHSNEEKIKDANWFDVMLTMKLSKMGRTVILPNGQQSLINGRNSIMFKSLINHLGKVQVEPLLEESKTNGNDNKSKSDDEGKK